MCNRLKSTKLPVLVACLTLLGLLLQACGGSSSTPGGNNSSGNQITLTVAFQQFGPPPYHEAEWWQKVKQQVEASNPNIKLKLLPVVADEGSYYTKIDLMMRSANTAPDLVREDSFLVGSDVTAGYLTPLDKYLDSWPEYKQQWFPSMQNITTFDGHNYGVMDGTDVRLIWYNKDIFKKAGLPIDWQPNTWADILSAANTVKEKVPGVIPMNLYSGIPMDEASTMQGFEMLLYGTKDPLYNYDSKKWVVSSKGFQDSLDFVKQVYNPSKLLGPTNDITLSTQAGNTVAQQLIPQGKLAIDIDGSWMPSNWVKGGAAEWPQWQQTMGMAKMPTQNGQDPKYVTLSGGWAYSISAQSKHKDEAFQVLKAAMSKDLLGGYDVSSANIAPRKDIVDVPEYKNQPGNVFFTDLVGFTQFRPGFPAYPKISVQIDSAMQHVMSGQSSADAMQAYDQAVTGIAGASNVEKH
ncbi:extracellular solute-binding protein [Ktedonosporobacter rubrisoli]|uniref:Extracellular solute-binding protein n=1 Tax=Ktedonosporobacter rubrisoli TaxID=2509675 RepID=A0A4P6K0X6_KTERU|nr:extracellular solute-binding protein [Ktedonosporobacter rubrisoli]QBD81797.1 extracellular solute-binding protein [Ktedonosporobacter rubrisoli]